MRPGFASALAALIPMASISCGITDPAPPVAPAPIAQQGGTTQQLPGGRTLVAYGSGGRVEEYDAAGNVMWRIYGNPGYVFRAQRIRSLYNPGLGLTR